MIAQAQCLHRQGTNEAGSGCSGAVLDSRRMEERNPALDRLDALVGDWSMEAGPPGGPPWPGEGRVSFEWLEGRTWLIERWHVDLPEAPDGIAIIGAGGGPESFRQYYFDSRGVRRIYEMTLDEGVWKLWRDESNPFPQRFEGRFEDRGRTIAGRWEKAEDGSSWSVDFDLTYRKAG
jgi:hypothetical protein